MSTYIFTSDPISCVYSIDKRNVIVKHEGKLKYTGIDIQQNAPMLLSNDIRYLRLHLHFNGLGDQTDRIKCEASYEMAKGTRFYKDMDNGNWYIKELQKFACLLIFDASGVLVNARKMPSLIVAPAKKNDIDGSLGLFKHTLNDTDQATGLAICCSDSSKYRVISTGKWVRAVEEDQEMVVSLAASRKEATVIEALNDGYFRFTNENMMPFTAATSKMSCELLLNKYGD